MSNTTVRTRKPARATTNYDALRKVRSRIYEIGVEANSIGFDAMQALLYKTFRPAGNDYYNFTEPAEMSKSAINCGQDLGRHRHLDGVMTRTLNSAASNTRC